MSIYQYERYFFYYCILPNFGFKAFFWCHFEMKIQEKKLRYILVYIELVIQFKSEYFEPSWDPGCFTIQSKYRKWERKMYLVNEKWMREHVKRILQHHVVQNISNNFSWVTYAPMFMSIILYIYIYCRIRTFGRLPRINYWRDFYYLGK